MTSQQVDSSTHPADSQYASLVSPIRVRYVAEINSTGNWIDAPSPVLKRKLPVWLKSPRSSSKKCKIEPDAEQKYDVGADASTSQSNDRVNKVVIKKEIKEEPEDDKPSGTSTPKPDVRLVKTESVVKEEATSSIRDSCEFGVRCYRRNGTHRSEMAHPGDQDYRRPAYPDPPLGTPNCKFGVCCYRRNPRHFQQFAHPPSSTYEYHVNYIFVTPNFNIDHNTADPEKNYNQKQMILRQRGVKKEAHGLDDDNEDDDLLDFSVDGDSDEYMPSDTDYNETEEL